MFLSVSVACIVRAVDVLVEITVVIRTAIRLVIRTVRTGQAEGSVLIAFRACVRYICEEFPSAQEDGT